MTIKIDEEIELRLLEESDADDIFKIINTERDYLGEWLPFVAFTQQLEDSQAFVQSVLSVDEAHRDPIFTIRCQDQCIGLIGFKGTDYGNHKTELGYWLSESYQKKGIVTRSVIALCEWAFEKLFINRIQIKCAVGNIPSKNIPQRLGFQLEGIERAGELLSNGCYTDLEIYSLLKDEYKK